MPNPPPPRHPMEKFTIAGRLLIVATIFFAGGFLYWTVIFFHENFPAGRYPIILLLIPVLISSAIFFGIVYGLFRLFGIRIHASRPVSRAAQPWPHPGGYEASPRQICEGLRKILDGKDPYAWDDFISHGPLKEPRLEAIRLRLLHLEAEFPPESEGLYCSPQGIEVIRNYVRELEHETTA